MFLTLILIVTQTVAEWVEISQQHYRKPMHTYNVYNPFTTPDRMEMEDTTKPWMYNNRSVFEYNWNEASKKQSNIGNIKRVFQESAIKSAEVLKNEEDNDDEFELRTNYEPTRPTIEFSDDVKQKGFVEKVPNIGNVKRVQLHNSPVKSPTIDMKGDGMIAKSRYEELPLNNEKGQAYENFPEIKSNSKRIYVNDLSNRFSNERANTFLNVEDDPSITEVQVLQKRPKPEIKNQTNQPKTFPSKVNIFTKTENVKYNGKNRYSDVNSGTTLAVTEKKIKVSTETVDINKADISKINEEAHKQLTNQNHKNDKPTTPNENIHAITKNRPLHKAPQTEDNKKINNVVGNDRKIHKTGETPKASNLENEINEKNSEDQSEINSTQEKEKKTESKKPTPENKMRNMENLLKIMKVVANTISQNTRRSFNGKVNYLHDLKDSILGNIAERIDATWPDDEVSAPHRRHSRAAQSASRGHHVQFPSSESALMTISFLTFAVFLIKLVLQIIQTYKNKAMMVAPVLVSSGGRTVPAQRGRL